MAIISVLNFIYFATIIISESCFSITDRAAVYLFISISIYILLSDEINGKKVIYKQRKTWYSNLHAFCIKEIQKAKNPWYVKGVRCCNLIQMFKYN